MKKENSKISTVLKLKNAGINYIGCKYNGGGDSGGIEDIYLCKDLPNEIIESGQINYDDDIDEVYKIEETKNYSELRSAAEDLFYPHLNEIEDWWNNDGGYGSAVIDLETMTINIDNNCYYTSEENYSHQEDLFQ